MVSALSRSSSRSFALVVAFTFAAAMLLASPREARAANVPTPALAAFARVWATVDDYRATVTDQERSNDGAQTTETTYDFRFKKPDLARIDVIAGRNRGGGATYHGGDSLVGHTGGFLSAIKMSIPLSDARAKSLRGGTIDQSSFGHQLREMLETPGALTESSGPDATTSVTLVPKATLPDGVTRLVLDISNANHLPVALRQYVGDLLVKAETFHNVQPNVGLADGDF